LRERPEGCIQLIDLNTGKCESRSWPTPLPVPVGDRYLNPDTLQVIDEGRKLLLGSTRWSEGAVAVLNLDGNRAPKAITSLEIGKILFLGPMWNENQQLVVIWAAVASKDDREHGQLWVYNSDLDLIEKVDAESVSKSWYQKTVRGQQSDEKYAWVMERRWPQRRKQPEAVEFQLKNHTIEQQHITRDQAASVW
jgi:hypothetical protein